MTKLERARRFLTGRTRAIALKVIPLAFLATSAYATEPSNSFLLDSQSFSTIHQSGGGSGSFSEFSSFSTSPLPLHNGFFGLSIIGSVDVGCSGGDCSGNTMDFRFTGHVSGPATPPTVANVFFHFNANLVPDPADYNWTFLQSGGPANYGDDVFGTGTTTVSGGNWTLDLDITPAAFSTRELLNVTLPSGNLGSIDITAPGATPEPDTIALTLAGLGGLFLLRRKKRTA